MFKFMQCIELRDAILNLFYFIRLAKKRALEDQEYVQCVLQLQRMERAININPGILERIACWWKWRSL